MKRILNVLLMLCPVLLLGQKVIKPDSYSVGRAAGSDNRSNTTISANGYSFEMVAVKGGTFTMGCTAEQGSDCDDNEKPSHQVSLDDYYMGKYVVTQGLWKAVMGSNPSGFKSGANYPVERVSWNDCQVFIKKLNSLTGKNFRLPTEAEWEYAARGGAFPSSGGVSAGRGGFKCAGSNDIDEVGWYDGNSGSKTHAVGTKKPNALGLYDMSGNVWEWCNDWYEDYSNESVSNPQGPSSGSFRVIRGSSWINNAASARVSNRNSNDPNSRCPTDGFRLAFTPPVIVPEEKVNTSKQIKEVEKIEESTISDVNQEGLKQPEVVIPPRVVTAPPSVQVDVDKIITAVDIKAAFPGGISAWSEFLDRNLNPNVAINKGAPAGSYRVYVTFTVSRKDGSLSDFQIENDPGYGMAKEVLRVMKKSPAWVPAQQNGRQVNSRFRQPFTFKITKY